MTLNDQIEALVLKNAVIKPVNMTTFKNPFLLLSSTRALNELVSNTAPSDRARQQGIEDDKAYLKTPSGARSDRKAPKTGKDAPKQDTQPMPPKRKATPKPATSSVKTPKTATVPTKEATAKAIKDAGKTVVKVAKAAKAKADKAAAAKARADKAAAKEAAKQKAAVAKADTARADKSLSKKDVDSLSIREPDPNDEVAVAIAKKRKEGKLKGGDRRLGTKTQKKKK